MIVDAGAEIREPGFRAVVGDEVRLERLVGGNRFAEGPLWDARDASLLWSDIAGDCIRRWSARDGVTVVRQPSHMANGLAWDREGRLLACEHATSRLTRTEADGRITALATHYDDRELNSPNDVACAPDGRIYFTDPPFGRMKFWGRPRPQALPFQGVYRVGADPRRPVLLVDDFDRPNGLCFSRDGRRLFVADSARGHIRVFDVREDGGLTGGTVWAELVGEGRGVPDGMTIDSAGHLYCCGPGGVHIFRPDGACLGVIRIPEYAANVAWGDADLRTLFVAATTSIYRVRVRVSGLAAG